MKRDMKVVQGLLEFMESRQSDQFNMVPDFEGLTEDQVTYQVRLCEEAGYLISRMPRAQGLERLTWLGHEALDRMRAQEKERQVKPPQTPAPPGGHTNVSARDHQHNLIAAADQAVTALDARNPEDMKDQLRAAMRRAANVSGWMDYYCDKGRGGAMDAAVCTEIAYLAASSQDGVTDQLRDTVNEAARACRTMAEHLPTSVEDQTRRDTEALVRNIRIALNKKQRNLT